MDMTDDSFLLPLCVCDHLVIGHSVNFSESFYAFCCAVDCWVK